MKARERPEIDQRDESGYAAWPMRGAPAVVPAICAHEPGALTNSDCRCLSLVGGGSRDRGRYPACFVLSDDCGLPNTMRVAGRSSPFETIHQQPHARQRK